MPVLRLDAAPAVDPALLPADVRESWAPGPDGVMRLRAPEQFDSGEAAPQKAHRPEGATTGPSTALALVPTSGGAGVVKHGTVLVNNSAVLAAQAEVDRKTKAKSSSAAELAAFQAGFNKSRTGPLFQRTNVASGTRSPNAAASAEGPEDAENDPAVAAEAPAAAAEAAAAGEALVPTADIDATTDYQGRSFMHYNAAGPSAFKPTKQAAVATRLVHAFKGHGAGVNALAWFPGTAHLLLSSDLAGEVMLWDVLGRRRVGRYSGHQGSIRSITFAADQQRFSSAGMDGLAREWDIETGVVLNTVSYNGESIGTHTYHPQRSHTILAGAGKNIVQWDTRVSPTKNVREYDAHHGSVLHVGFINDHFFVSTSEDKTLRTWDVDSSVTVQDFADAAMHAVPHFAVNPTNGVLAAQSLDNRVNHFAPMKAPGKFRLLKDRVCKGHSVSGSTCRLAFSADGRYLSSGDVSGELHVWDAETCEPMKKFRAHTKALAAHLWHPLEKGRIVTAGWDGVIKMFAAS